MRTRATLAVAALRAAGVLGWLVDRDHSTAVFAQDKKTEPVAPREERIPR